MGLIIVKLKGKKSNTKSTEKHNEEDKLSISSFKK
jgi:hypothetical protein